MTTPQVPVVMLRHERYYHLSSSSAAGHMPASGQVDSFIFASFFSWWMSFEHGRRFLLEKQTPPCAPAQNAPLAAARNIRKQHWRARHFTIDAAISPADDASKQHVLDGCAGPVGRVRATSLMYRRKFEKAAVNARSGIDDIAVAAIVLRHRIGRPSPKAVDHCLMTPIPCAHAETAPIICFRRPVFTTTTCRCRCAMSVAPMQSLAFYELTMPYAHDARRDDASLVAWSHGRSARPSR